MIPIWAVVCIGLDVVRLLVLKSTGSRCLLSDEFSSQQFLQTMESFLWWACFSVNIRAHTQHTHTQTHTLHNQMHTRILVSYTCTTHVHAPQVYAYSNTHVHSLAKPDHFLTQGIITCSISTHAKKGVVQLQAYFVLSPTKNWWVLIGGMRFQHHVL